MISIQALCQIYYTIIPFRVKSRINDINTSPVPNILYNYSLSSEIEKRGGTMPTFKFELRSGSTEYFSFELNNRLYHFIK